MPWCYDRVPRASMVFRALIAVAMVVLCASAHAEWRAVATPQKSGLPVIDVECGYPGGYVSSAASPIRMRARTGASAFDGYIGFHVVVDGIRTIDVPVISRAQIAPHSEWTFSTWLDIRGGDEATRRLPNRELVIAWHDARRALLEEKSLGQPPWSDPRPLRIAGASETSPSDRALGDAAVVIAVAALSREPRWYAGFSAVVVPLAVWFEVPEAVRMAIFRSGSRVHFFGTVSSMPRLAEIDRALLPIELMPEPGGPAAAPWPFAAGIDRVPISWRAKPQTRVIGSPALPHLVVSNIAAYAATEEAVRNALPVFAVGVVRELLRDAQRAPSIRINEILRDYRPLVAFCTIALISVIAWFAIRHVAPSILLPALAAIGLLVVGAREWIRRIEVVHTYSSTSIVAPGVVDIRTVHRDVGQPPRTLAPEVMAKLSGGLTHRFSWHIAEIRDSDTAPGLGALLVSWNWSHAVRRGYRRDLGTPATIRVESRSADEVTIAYEATQPIDYVIAQWAWRGTMREGMARAGSKPRGRVVVRDGERVPADLRRGAALVMDNVAPPNERVTSGEALVALMSADRDATTLIRSVTSSTEPVRVPYRMSTRLRPGETNGPMASFVLPAPPSQNAACNITLSHIGPSSLALLRGIRVGGPAGQTSIDLDVARRGAGHWSIAAAELRRIAPDGGVIRVTVDADAAADLTRAWAGVSVLEGKQ